MINSGGVILNFDGDDDVLSLLMFVPSRRGCAKGRAQKRTIYRRGSPEWITVFHVIHFEELLYSARAVT